MTQQIPTIGRIVRYTLSEQDADAINRRRTDAARNMAAHREKKNGSQVHIGNSVYEGEVFPLVITRVWGDQPESAVNGQVLLDGNDTLWVSSVNVGEGPRTFAWPTRA
jgi:hypothetical protein